MKTSEIKKKIITLIKGKNVVIYLPTVITIIVLLAMTGAAFFSLRGWDDQRFISDFENHSDLFTDSLKTNLSRHLEILSSIERLYRSSLDIAREDFSTFVNSHVSQHTCIESLGWIPRVADNRRIIFEYNAQSEGFTDFQFTELLGDGEIIGATERDEYYPLYYVEPVEGNESILGLDIVSEPTLAASLNQAVETGDVIASPPLSLLSVSDQETEVFVFMPVFFAHTDMSTPEGRTQGLEGFVLGIFRIPNMMEIFLDDGLYKNLEIELYDSVGSPEEQLLFSSGTGPEKGIILPPNISGGIDSYDGTRYTEILDFAGRQWLLSIRPSEEYLASVNTWYPWGVLIIGLLLTFSVGYTLIVRIRHTLNIGQLAAELSSRNQELQVEVAQTRLTQAELRASETKYSQLVEQANDGIRIVQDDTIVFTNSKMNEMTGISGADYKGRYFYEFVAPEYKEMLLERHRRRLAGEKVPDRYEIEILNKDGDKIPVEINVSNIEYNGKPANMAVIRDITERKQAEEAMENEATQRRILVQGSRDGIVVLDEKGGVYEANKRFAEMLGYTPEEIRCLSIWDWDHQRTPEETLDKLKTADEKGDHFETHHHRKDGSVIDVEISINAAMFGNEKLVFCVCRDITERKRQERLRQAENHILTLLGQDVELNEILDAIVTLGEEFEPKVKGSILKYDPVTGKLHAASCNSLPPEIRTTFKGGLTVDKAAGSCGSAAYHKKRVIIPDIAASNEFQVFKHALRVTSENGLLACWTQPILSSGDELLGTITNYSRKKGQPDEKELEVLDWSARIAAIAIEHKMAEESLKLSEETFSQVFYANPMPMILLVSDGQVITDINEAFKNFSGFSRDECIGKPIDALDTLPDVKDRQKIIESLEKQGRITNLEILMKIKSGEIRNILLSAEPITLGGKLHYINTHRDITLQRQIEKEKEETEQKAYLSSRLAAVGQMAAGVAHEINNPLTGVLGFTDLLIARDDVPEDIRKDLEVISEGAQRVSKIVKGMLTFARNDNTERSLVNINDILKTTLSLRSYKMMTDNIGIKLSIDNKLPLTLASGGQLQQVFLNLIINAEQAIDKTKGEGRLTIKTKHVSGIIRIVFQDNGTGISQENIGKVFEPFFTTKEPGEGTGLGLSLCYGIIQEHGGQMYVKSREGKGATFIIELPVADVDKQRMTLPDTETMEKSKSKHRILVVDDEKVVRTYLDRFLSKEGHDVELTDNAGKALEIIPDDNFDLILMDIKMPEMNGMELYRKIRKMNRSFSRKVMFITGDVLAADTRAFFRRYNLPYISKPIDKNQLRKEISRILD